MGADADPGCPVFDSQDLMTNGCFTEGVCSSIGLPTPTANSMQEDGVRVAASFRVQMDCVVAPLILPAPPPAHACM
eukprot:gene5084-5185_t